ncbi:MOSC domain-containing protein [Herbiconiux moechotypicola]|uniref:MOSC domain-containing protein n=1 Tax=Herbiconiux moechotypicola TaxID=637393 RepID=A0ABN3D941_9MICO|nr:MOSC domain-containing protein [Herbiconiux moechotypicola]MCS5728157.1 MOSC domain-containing protein [Herbiconiux moechotypicola]
MTTPASAPAWRGTLSAVFVAEAAGVEMHALDEARMLEGIGIEGDRYATHRGHYSHLWHVDRQVTLIAQETIDALNAETGLGLEPVETRRNLVTAGAPLGDLVGTTFAVGEVLLHGGRLNVPCRYLERLIDKAVFEPLVGRSGLNCSIVRGGVIRPGDAIVPVHATAATDAPGATGAPGTVGDRS